MMTKYVLICCTFFLFKSFLSTAQENKPVVTKGYYAIGNNVQKLKRSFAAIQVQVGGSTTTVQKGYYNIGNNQDKLAAPLQTVTPSTKPVIQKGYYSIGNNAEKLRR
jgi:hypothetical protein